MHGVTFLVAGGIGVLGIGCGALCPDIDAQEAQRKAPPAAEADTQLAARPAPHAPVTLPDPKSLHGDI